MMCGSAHGVKGPGLVGVPGVDATKCVVRCRGSLHLAEQRALVMVDVVSGLRGRAWEVQVAAVRGGRAGGRRARRHHRRPAAVGAVAHGGGGAGRALRRGRQARARGRGAGRVAALRGLLPRVEALAHGRICKRRRRLVRQLVALRG